ncbi:MAG: CRISPR-associated endonuclease Cas2 [Gammaproteobacteria bacterium]|nr:CRISPR-associated endonuclease Cas2 [Gammaproteobacteria bacterium]MBU1655923.1 CRISPR-associated endonuclease Cas2 [Gammaproteobacteria bacterium]MBU1961795.1 CRISPR-associated endonuclease Cas2 [Gammaproteobacteria bacterium]
MILVCYDITDNRRRYRLERLLHGFGARVQKSIFECHISPAEHRELIEEIEALIDKEDDNVRLYDLCGKDLQRILVDGVGEVTQDWDYLLY